MCKYGYIETKIWKQNVKISLYRDENVEPNVKSLF